MNFKSSLILITCISLFFTFSNFANLKSYSIMNISNDSLYSEKVENFLQTNLEIYQFNASAMVKQDSFSKSLIGSKFDNFKFKDINNLDIDLKEINVPIVFENTASWCKPCNAIIPVLNQLSEKYKGKVKIILLTHDAQVDALKFSVKFNKNIILIPSEKGIDPTELIKSKSGNYKNIFSFPTTYFLDINKRIVEVKSGGAASGTYEINGKKITTTKEKAFTFNLKNLNESILKIL